MSQRDHAELFLGTLFRYVPPELHAMLWTRRDKRSHWHNLEPGVAPLVDQAVSLAEHDDVYVGVSAAEHAGGPHNRIEAVNSAGIAALWADVDVADEAVHAKSFSLPPTVDDALEVIDRCGVPPSALVQSGHGLQAWWFLAEFWQFETPSERNMAAQLAQRWNTTLRVHAAANKWIVDSTFDLSRLMRVPGTWNRKIEDDVKPVVLLNCSETVVYNPSDFEGFMVDDKYLAARGISPSRSYQVSADLVVSEGNVVSQEKLEAFRDNDPLFESTWQRKRTARSLPDQSMSSYDASLAVQAVRVGWTDQEIAGLILAFRRKHKEGVDKALRPDYIKKTIAFARNAAAVDDSTEAMDVVADELADAQQSGDPEAVRDARRAALDVIGAQLGLEVLHFIRYTSEPPTFEMVLPAQKVFLGGSDGILNSLKFRASVWESTRHQVPRFSNPAWDRLTELIARAWEDQDLGSESTARGQMEGWMSAYLAARPPVANVEEAVDVQYPYIEAGTNALCIFGPAFKNWLWLTYQERVDSKALGRQLRSIGFVPGAINTTDPRTQRPTSRAIWRLVGYTGGGEPAALPPAVPPLPASAGLRAV